MAINNGNTDFNLAAYQYGVNGKQLFIKFKSKTDGYSGIGQNPIVITVSGGRGAFSKTFTLTNYTSDTDWSTYVDVPQFGGYKVRISTNQGYSYDYKDVFVRLHTAVTSTYKYTSSDELWAKANPYIRDFIFAGIGFAMRLNWATAGIYSVAIILASFYADNTTFDNTLQVTEGWTNEITLSMSSDTTVQAVIKEFNKQGQLMKTLTQNYPIFPPN